MLMNLMLHSLSHSEKEISETAQLEQLEPYIAILREMAKPVLRGPVSSRTSPTSTKSASAQEELAQAQEPVSGLLTAITALTALLAPSIPVLIRGDKEELAQEQQLQQLGPTTRAILGLMAGGDQAEAEVNFPALTSLVNRRPILSRSVLSRLTPTIAKFYNEASIQEELAQAQLDPVTAALIISGATILGSSLPAIGERIRNGK